MKFSELIKMYNQGSESFKVVLEKIEKQFYRSCQKHDIDPNTEGEGVMLKSTTGTVEAFYFEYQDKRISMYMIPLPTGDLILTEDPESFISITQEQGFFDN
jgi:hypothetical protein